MFNKVMFVAVAIACGVWWRDKGGAGQALGFAVVAVGVAGAYLADALFGKKG